MFIREQQTIDPVNQVIHIAKRTRLGPIAEDGQGFAAQGLLDHVGDDAPVIQAHTRAIGIENADDMRIHFVGVVVCHRHGFSKTLGLIVHRAQSDRVNVAPIAFRLGMFERVAINLRGGSQQKARSVGTADAETIVRTKRTGLHGLDTQVGVAIRRIRVGAGG